MNSLFVISRRRNPHHAGEWLEGIKYIYSQFTYKSRNPHHAGEWLEGKATRFVICVWGCRNPHHAGEWLEAFPKHVERVDSTSRNPHHAGEWLEDVAHAIRYAKIVNRFRKSKCTETDFFRDFEFCRVIALL